MRHHSCDPRSDYQCEVCAGDQVAWEREQEAAPGVRCVWLTETQASRCPVDVMRAWDAAPADATTAIAQAVCVEYQLEEEDAWTCVPAVLRALGAPNA